MYINPDVVNRVVEIASRGSAMLVSFSQPMAELLEREHYPCDDHHMQTPSYMRAPALDDPLG